MASCFQTSRKSTRRSVPSSIAFMDLASYWHAAGCFSPGRNCTLRFQSSSVTIYPSAYVPEGRCVVADSEEKGGGIRNVAGCFSNWQR